MKRRPFDIIESDLSGVNLVEAGAGTGKTYAISGLFVRLILEKELPVENILVVTYTKSATMELKDRIHKRLSLARDLLEGKKCTDELIGSVISRSKDLKKARISVNEALANFDRSCIFTIHGFCQRVLHEMAFETGQSFDLTLQEDPTEIGLVVAEDFWRRHVSTLPSEILGDLLGRLGNPERLFSKRLALTLRDPLLKPEVPFRIPSFEAVVKGIEKLKEVWDEQKEAVVSCLMDPCLNGNKYGSLAVKSGCRTSPREIRVKKIMDACDRIIRSGKIGDTDYLLKISSGYIKDATRKKMAPPRNPVFDLVEEILKDYELFAEEINSLEILLAREFFVFYDRKIEDHKKRQNLLFFDDLLKRVKEAAEKDGSLLATRLKQRFPAVLVDEFQDTDTIQNSIFRLLFGGGQTLFFMIGDPKQAIYGFRGADLFSYIRAAEFTSNRYTLLHNWRSDPSLVEAVNAIFSSRDDPFLLEGIDFDPAVAAREKDPREDATRMVMWLDPDEGPRRKNKDEIYDEVCDAVSKEIVLITSGQGAIFKEGDIAVLVRKHRQALLVKKSLSKRGIPSVLYSGQKVFDTEEAVELKRVMAGILHPGREKYLRAALVTDIIGILPHELPGIAEKGREMELIVARFYRYRDVWFKKGFMPMLLELMRKEGVKKRILSLEEGERKITNLIHLSEILQEVSASRHFSPEQLLRWFHTRLLHETMGVDEEQIRLESDAKAVRILTIHKSKGLEFPVVFCPFAWEGIREKTDIILFHDPENDRRLTLDLGSKSLENSRKMALAEDFAESIRLLYVALTRAGKRCYLAWGRYKSAAISPLAYLLHFKENPSSFAELPEKLKKSFIALEKETFLQDIKNLGQRAGGSISIRPLSAVTCRDYTPTKESAPSLVKPVFKRDVDREWMVTSYSGLIRASEAMEIAPDVLERSDDDSYKDYQELEEKGGLDIHAFPRGIKTGLFFHDLLEKFDFKRCESEENARLVTESLKLHALDESWAPLVYDTLKRLSAAPLVKGAPFCLADIKKEDIVSEMPFYFPIKRITSRRLNELYRDFGMKTPFFNRKVLEQRLSFSPVKGYLKGFVDMVFSYNGRYYLLDWKTNHLGNQDRDYDEKRIAEAMVSHHYFLQYHLYVLALDRHLELKLKAYDYTRDFGGVLYLFIRGFGPNRPEGGGIFFDRPENEFIKRLKREILQ